MYTSMRLELVPEEEMVSKQKKKDETKLKTDIKIIREPKDTGGINITRDEDIKKDISLTPKSGDNVSGIRPTIVKRIYFPGDAYSRNQVVFKKILAAHGLAWIRGMMKTYTSKTGGQLLTGMYATGDSSKKVFAIYEGTNKPMTAIVKIIGTGGNFLIDIGSFCHKVGCLIEDKDEMFVNKTMLVLQEGEGIYVEKKMENKTLEDIQREYEEKVAKRLDEAIERFVESHRFVYDDRCESLFWKRGLSEKFIRKFRRMEIEKDVRWSIENNI